MSSGKTEMEQDMRKETDEDAHAVERCPNCGYGRSKQKKVVPVRRRRGSTQGYCVSLLMRGLAIVGMLVWAIDCMAKMYVNLGPERRWIFYLVVTEGVVVVVGCALFIFWNSDEED